MSRLTETQALIVQLIENGLKMHGTRAAEPALIVALVTNALPSAEAEKWMVAVDMAKKAEADRWTERMADELNLIIDGVAA
ncbi:MAG: hypothetical protein VXW65_05585 [Pseudomonadota bacterium]|nr:hypothetical protein [Pseudomonadota bacterium]